jgi:hypothetical protein
VFAGDFLLEVLPYATFDGAKNLAATCKTAYRAMIGRPNAKMKNALEKVAEERKYALFQSFLDLCSEHTIVLSKPPRKDDWRIFEVKGSAYSSNVEEWRPLASDGKELVSSYHYRETTPYAVADLCRHRDGHAVIRRGPAQLARVLWINHAVAKRRVCKILTPLDPLEDFPSEGLWPSYFVSWKSWTDNITFADCVKARDKPYDGYVTPRKKRRRA